MSKHRHKKAAGGGTPATEEPKNKHETDPEEPAFKEAASKEESFKRGGRKARAHGGRVDGMKGHMHLGKKARGGRAMAKGGVLSAASSIKSAHKRGSSDSESLEVD